MKKIFLAAVLLSTSFFTQYTNAKTIQTIEIVGSTVFSSQEINSLVTPYLEQELNQQKLQELTTKLTKLYVESGYITSGAFLPEQEIINGKVKIEVIEGKLTEIEVEGLKRLKKSYVNSRFKKVTQGIFNQNELQKALESLYLDPLIEDAEAELVRGSGTDNLLWLDIKEAPLIQTALKINNRASPTIGEVRGIARLTHNNLLGIRDRALIQYDVTEGFSTYELDYAVPLNYGGTALGLGYRGGESRIIEEPFDDVNIRAEADTFSVKLTQELARSLTRESSLSLIFDISESKTFIFDERPFAFPGSPKDGLSKLSVLRLEGDWLKRSDVDILSIRSRLSLGVDLFEATVRKNEPDALFLSWLGQVQYAKTLNKDQNIVFITRLAAQLTPDSLLPFEKFALGGATTVRGYRHNRSIGDNGIVGTIGISFTVVEDDGWGNLSLIPFVDVGRVWDTDGDFGRSLTSVGLGIDWQLRDSLFIGFDWGIPLTEVQKRGESLGDSGIHFSLEWKP